MSDTTRDSRAYLLKGRALTLLFLAGSVYVILGVADKVQQEGWGRSSLADRGVLCTVVIAALLYIASIVVPFVPPWRVVGVYASRLLLRIALTLFTMLIAYTAVLEPKLAAGLALAALLYGLIRVLSWLSRTLPVLWEAVLLNSTFPLGIDLPTHWDEVHGGYPGGMLSVTDEGLRIGWEAGQTYDDTGYVIKSLPNVDLRIEAEIMPLTYGAGWDPGLHFYRDDLISYCLSLGLIPQGYGPEGFNDTSGLAVRTENPEHPVGWTEHLRLPVPANSSAEVSVEIRGQQCRVTCDGQSTEILLACRPNELVVGAWKPAEPNPYASQNGAYVVRRVRVTRI